MTIAEAKAELSKPLEFGNPGQIKAREFLERVIELRARLNLPTLEQVECGHCSGMGVDTVECYCQVLRGEPDPHCQDCQGDGVEENDCSSCRGTGYEAMQSEDGEFEESDPEVIKAAKSLESIAL